MTNFKIQVSAHLNQHELELLKQAQEKYITDGKGDLSIRKILLMGVYSIIGLDVKTDS